LEGARDPTHRQDTTADNIKETPVHRRKFGATAIVGTLTVATSLMGSHVASATTPARHQAATLQYGFQAIASPHDPTFTQLLGINNRQVIAGYDGSGQTVNGVLHPNMGFTLALPSNMSAETFPNSAQTQVIGINNQDETGGFYVDQSGNTHGFLSRRGQFTTVDLAGTTFNQILGLNNRGQAVGYFQDTQGINHAYVRDARGTFVVPPIPNSQATGINDAGVVVGFTQPTTTTSSAFILRDEQVRIFNFPGATFTQALGENNRGQIVGTYNDAAGTAHGFIYDRGHFRSIDVPGSNSTVINGINDEGRIVGFFTDANGNTVGAVGSPGTGKVTVVPPILPPVTQPQSTTVTIGLVLPLSGPDAALGLSAENGARLAIDQANVAPVVPGVVFTLAAKDDAGDAATGASDVKALIGDARVAGIVGPFDTATALAELPLANQAPIAMISPSAGNPCLTSNDPAFGCAGQNDLLATVRPTGKVTFFRTLPTDPEQGTMQADYLSGTKRFHTAYVIDDTAAYGLGVANAFIQEWQKLGGIVVGHSSVLEGTPAYVNLLTQIAARRPDVIFFGGNDPASGTPASILIRQQMLQVPGLQNTAFAGGDGIRTQQFALTIGALGGGPVYSTLTPSDATFVPAAGTFVQQYQAAFGAPGRYSASGYDAATVLLAAIKAAIANKVPLPTKATDQAASYRQAVIAGVGPTNLTGVLGPLSFTAAGDLANGRSGIEQLVAGNGSAVWKPVA
jgi:branched-chain amino acid transport system substrate-binding protein